MGTPQKILILAIVAALFYAVYLVYPPQQKINLGLDLQGGLHLVLEVQTDKLPVGAKPADAVDRALEIIRNRVDGLGVAEPSIQRQGEKWIVVQLPGIKDKDRALDLIGKTALLEFKLQDTTHSLSDYLDKNGDPMPSKVPADLEVVPGKEQKYYLLESKQLMTGSALSDAKVVMDSYQRPVVNFTLTKEYADKFADLTSENIGRYLAIILDGRVYSAPVIRTRIDGGSGQIEGHFSLDEAKDLALVLRSGALPAPIAIIHNQLVGPSLGADSIKAGIISAIVGICAVMLWMIIYYRISGFIADIGMLVNFVFLMAFLCGVHATLTMPGIAGIILTMGMSVDSNVLIFERIREELRAGKTVRAAIDGGYSHALWTIIDSHVTTLITAAVLFQFGSGPVKGFAVTLFWGVVISLFTAVVITKIIFDLRKQYSSLSI